MKEGFYCLIFCNQSCTIRVGALGEIFFQPGYHMYVGSAQGTGGLSRVIRHIRLAKHKNKAPHWHIDYLLINESFTLIDVICAATTQNLECVLANLMPGLPVPGFGCSDCNCISHLFFCQQKPLKSVKLAFSKTGVDKNQIEIHHTGSSH